MAHKELTACTWYLNMGADVIRGKHWENALEVLLEYGRNQVTIAYFKGTRGLEERDSLTVAEAIEWLNIIQREWSEYGSQVGSMIDGLRRYQV